MEEQLPRILALG